MLPRTDLVRQLEQLQGDAANIEKRQRKFDQQVRLLYFALRLIYRFFQVAAMQAKLDEAQQALDQSQKDQRSLSTEVLTLRGAHETANDQIEALKRENKHLQDEVAELTHQLGAGGKSSHDLEMAKKKLAQEKQDLQAQLEETEGELTLAEQRAESLQLQISRLRGDQDHALAEKDEQIEELRKSISKQVDAVREQLEEEIKAKNDKAKQAKKMESDLAEANLRNDATQKANADLQKLVKKLQQQLKDATSGTEAEERAKAEQREALARAERRAQDLSSELEELRGQVEQLTRAKKTLDAELQESHELLEAEQSGKTALYEAKRKLEAKVSQLQEV